MIHGSFYMKMLNNYCNNLNLSEMHKSRISYSSRSLLYLCQENTTHVRNNVKFEKFNYYKIYEYTLNKIFTFINCLDNIKHLCGSVQQQKKCPN